MAGKLLIQEFVRKTRECLVMRGVSLDKDETVVAGCGEVTEMRGTMKSGCRLALKLDATIEGLFSPSLKALMVDIQVDDETRIRLSYEPDDLVKYAGELPGVVGMLQHYRIMERTDKETLTMLQAHLGSRVPTALRRGNRSLVYKENGHHSVFFTGRTHLRVEEGLLGQEDYWIGCEDEKLVLYRNLSKRESPTNEKLCPEQVRRVYALTQELETLSPTILKQKSPVFDPPEEQEAAVVEIELA